MGIFQSIRKVLKKQYAKELLTDGRTNFNEKTGNSIFSAFASTASITGHDVEVRENTIIDDLSDLGSYTYVGMNSAITKSTIGRYCSIGNNVSIGPGEHDLTAISTSAQFYAIPADVLTQKDCIIGNDVWIGVDSIIRRGVKIGDGAVIGANSVVTADVPPYGIVAGSPAKLIRYRFNERAITHLLKVSWWNYELHDAKQLLEKLKTEVAALS